MTYVFGERVTMFVFRPTAREEKGAGSRYLGGSKVEIRSVEESKARSKEPRAGRKAGLVKSRGRRVKRRRDCRLLTIGSPTRLLLSLVSRLTFTRDPLLVIQFHDTPASFSVGCIGIFPQVDAPKSLNAHSQSRRRFRHRRDANPPRVRRSDPGSP